MTKVKYLIIGFFIVGLITVYFALSGISGKPDENDTGIKYLIGVSQPNLTQARRIYMNQQIKAEASKYPDAKVIFCDAADDDIKQKRDIEKMMDLKADLMIITPNNSKFLSETISKVYAKGIPVIIMENPIESEDYSTFIFSDNYKLGRYAGEYVAEILGKQGGTVLEVQGDPGSPLTIKRKKGFRDAIAANPAVSIGYVVVGYWSRDKAEDRVKEIYKKDPKVDVVFAHNDSMAIGAWRSAAYDRLTARFIGIDGLPVKNGGLEAVSNGLLDATFIYPTGGREAVEYALKILKGEKVPKSVELPVVKVTKNNVGQYLK